MLDMFGYISYVISHLRIILIIGRFTIILVNMEMHTNVKELLVMGFRRDNMVCVTTTPIIIMLRIMCLLPITCDRRLMKVLLLEVVYYH